MIPDYEEIPKGPAMMMPEDKPVRVRLTPHGIKLAFYHGTEQRPPFKVTIPREQWAQLNQLIAGDMQIAFVGFTPETLALHRIDAVEVPELNAINRAAPSPFFPNPNLQNNED